MSFFDKNIDRGETHYKNWDKYLRFYYFLALLVT